MTTKPTLQKLLKQHIVEIKFKKIDGSDRTMICSLKKSLLPESETDSTANPSKRVKKENPNAIAVWDLEKDAFRSFRVDSVIDYQIISEGYEF
jgi:uncharacterized protein (DUF736 family)